MTDYIDRKAAIDAVLDVFYDTTDIDLSGEKFEAEILNIQAADVEPVRHGRWITVGVNYYTRISQCTNCCAKYDFRSKYCPNCGARMDEEVWR